MTDTPKTQDEIDSLMRSMGQATYDSRYSRALEMGRESTTPAGNHLLRSSVSNVCAALFDWDLAASKNRNKTFPIVLDQLRTVGYEQASLIACQIILDSFSQVRDYRSIAFRIASELRAEARFRYIAEHEPDTWLELKRAVKDKSKNWKHLNKSLTLMANKAEAVKAFGWGEDWTRADRLRVGTVLVELVARKTKIIRIKSISKMRRRGGKRIFEKELLVVATPEAEAWFKEATEFGRNNVATFLPTVIPPLPWESQFVGGYHTNIIRRMPICKTSKTHRGYLTAENVPKVYAALNTVQETPWAVNRDVFETFAHLWKDEGNEVAGLPPVNPIELPPTPREWIQGSEEVKEWKRRARRIHTRNTELTSHRAIVSAAYDTARTFLHQPFWYPHKVDFRSRVYPIPTCGMSPQGTDLGRGLLQFAEGLPIDNDAARMALDVHGANVFGEDKTPLNERVDWVRKNLGMITRVANDPLDCRDWTKASEPWQFLAFCFEKQRLEECTRNGTTLVSTLPVSQDATSSGLQIYSLLLRDRTGANATNVTPSGKRQDIYQDVADVASKYLIDIMEGRRRAFIGARGKTEDADELGPRFARNWLSITDGSLSRSLAKRPVMVLPYGGTRYSTRKYTDEWYYDYLIENKCWENPPLDDANSHIVMLATVLWEAMGTVIRSSIEAMDWLRKAASLGAAAGVGLYWDTPSGFRVQQDYRHSEAKRVTTMVGRSCRIHRNYWEETDKVDTKRQSNGLPPNFIHSLDSALLVNTVNSLRGRGITHLGVVHDCYTSHAATAAEVGTVLREETASMFSTDILGTVKQSFEEQIGSPLPDLPEYGDLDPSEVLQSTYYFN